MKRQTLFFLLLTYYLAAYAQSIYSPQNRQKFADYLFSENEYHLAIAEYQALINNNFINDTILVNFFDAARISGYSDFLNKPDISDLLKCNYNRKPLLSCCKYLVSVNKLSIADSLIKCNSVIAEKEKDYLYFYNSLISGNSSRIREAKEKLPAEDLAKQVKIQNILNNYDNIRRKSPFVAGVLSAVVPGLGKVYTANFGDAAQAFIFTGIAGFEAYRGFERYGTKSLLGWVMSVATFSFYSANIWGSVKAAKVFNRKAKEKIIDDAKNLYYNLD